MKLAPVKCPGCSADLSFSDDGAFLVCAYCGTKIMRPVEDPSAVASRAELIRAETEQIETLNRIEKEKAEREAGEQRAFFGLFENLLRNLSRIAIGLVLLAIVFFCVFSALGNVEKWIFAGLSVLLLYLFWSRRGRRLLRRLSRTISILIVLLLVFALILAATGKLDDLFFLAQQYLHST